MSKSPQQRANLRVCASCEWVYKGHGDCPKCGFASYGARYVYGRRCYDYINTQEPWVNKKLADYAGKLRAEVAGIQVESSKIVKFYYPDLDTRSQSY
jgi:hypothetical protein